MIWDQLLSSWDRDVNSVTDFIQNHCVGNGLLPTHTINLEVVAQILWSLPVIACNLVVVNLIRGLTGQSIP